MSAAISSVQSLPQHVIVEKADDAASPSQSKLHKIVEKIKAIFAHNKEKIWAIPREVLNITISALSFIAAGDVSWSISDVPSSVLNEAITVQTSIAGLGLISFVSMFENLINIPFKLKDGYDRGAVGDVEGAVFSSIDAAGSALEVVYNFSIGFLALGSVGVIPFITAFSLTVIPIAVGLLIYASAKNVYDIVHQAAFLYSIPYPMLDGDKSIELLKSYLDAQMRDQTVKGSEIKFSAKKLSVIDRRTDDNVVILMKQLRIHLESKVDIKKTNESLKHIKKFIWCKIGIGVINFVANIAFLITLIATAIFSGLPDFAAPIVGTVRGVISYLVVGLNLGLNKWHENKMPVFLPIG